jgi:hypothetical protein
MDRIGIEPQITQRAQIKAGAEWQAHTCRHPMFTLGGGTGSVRSGQPRNGRHVGRPSVWTEATGDQYETGRNPADQWVGICVHLRHLRFNELVSC